MGEISPPLRCIWEKAGHRCPIGPGRCPGHEFRRLYSKGRSAVSPYFVLYCRPNRRSYSRLGITTGVKLGNAVKRNRARRRIRELYRGEEQALLPGYDIVVVARTRVIYGKYADLQRSFRRLTEKLELRRGREAGEAL